ncbi:hypothetical protein OG458_40880 [Streptomyces sp. NBC_01281]|uniref:hypothetical protein n=1 Tax=unclassified Streptomyces TaxID=2593676 RepID=UPI0013B97B55|nr:MULTISPECIES: hypothetical protein [unclassified Streptomyces]NEB29244.1 hypothetical protein [Streptomyces sp. SID14446]WSK65750.1 hypothetical protein OG458_40880 [Streptomyces sp. NBC_01281]
MLAVEPPGPEPDWEPAPHYQGGKRNPALQNGMWENAASSLRLVAGLSPSLDLLAARLRLTVEQSWEDLGPVQVAMFRIQGIDFALHRPESNPRPDVFVWISRAQTDTDAALGLLLDALGIGTEAITFRADDEGTFVDLHTSQP